MRLNLRREIRDLLLRGCNGIIGRIKLTDNCRSNCSGVNSSK